MVSLIKVQMLNVESVLRTSAFPMAISRRDISMIRSNAVSIFSMVENAVCITAWLFFKSVMLKSINDIMLLISCAILAANVPESALLSALAINCL